ncbi:unnamed protein product, partial [Allacma fusca]
HLRAYQILASDESFTVVALTDVFLASPLNTSADTLESNKTGSVTMETQGDVVTVFISNTNANTSESSTELQTIQANTIHKRTRKRKLFFDEEDKMINVKAVLLQHDKEMRVSYGADVIKTSESLKPLPPKLRRHLVKLMCQHLIKKTHSAMPSTDQRDQLAGCIVTQLYSTFTGKEYKQLKESYFSPSTTVLDPQTGKKKSTSPTGHIQYHFKIFWSSIRQSNGSLKLECNAD